jgi:hypothetical protein
MTEKTVRIDEDLHRWAKFEAVRRGVPLQEVLDELIRQAKEKQEQEQARQPQGQKR